MATDARPIASQASLFAEWERLHSLRMRSKLAANTCGSFSEGNKLERSETLRFPGNRYCIPSY
ncbi:Hypothetical predicted protein, partial [Pelobates cultripes]